MRFAPLFHDHAVLQRGMPLPVWGTATPQQEVIVELAGRRARAVASETGAWLVRLPALSAGGPYELVARCAGEEIRADGILIGEVWLCSGQSNMGMRLAATGQSGDLGDLSRIRLLTVATPACFGRQETVDGRWQHATPETLAEFSAVGGWFGRALQQALDVPLGLINNAWGGTRIQAWMSREALMADPEGADEVRHYERYVYASEPPPGEEYASMADWEQRGPHQDAGNSGLAAGWAAADCPDQSWQVMPLPRRWQDHGHPGSGVFWFRRSVELPAGWSGQDLELHLGAIDKHDDTYVAGERVGGLSWSDGPATWNTRRVYHVPGRLVGRDGARRLVIAVRARSHVFHGGMTGPAAVMAVHPVDRPQEALPLAGEWRYRIEQDWGIQTPPTPLWMPGDKNAPWTLFDSRLAPLIPYALRGVAWYQGESNVAESALYRRLLPQLIRDWRRAWGQGDFPFIQVQLANHQPPSNGPIHSRWAGVRDAQLAALAEPATGLAVAIDVGEAEDIHPRDKRTVGLCLTRWALAETYCRGGLPSGPLFSGAIVEADGRMRCRFRHATGLRTRDGAMPSHIDLAGPDRVFIRAQAVIDGESLVVWSPEIRRPVAVRYAWADNPAGCNLINDEDLPASPFRSDDW